MFCPKCGAQLPDESKFCRECGASIATEPQQSQPTQQQPVQPQSTQQPLYMQYQQPVVSIKKKEYLAKHAPQKVKNLVLVAWILFALSVISLGLGLSNAFNAEMKDVPFWTVMTELAEVDLDDLEDETEYDVMHAEHLLDYAKNSDADKSDIKALKNGINRVEDKLSMSNLLAFYSAYDALDDSDSFEEGRTMLTIILIVACVMFFLPLLFAVLGGLLHNTGLTIAALVFTIPAQLVFGGTVWLILSIVATVAHIVILSQISKNYKNFRMTGVAA